MNCRPLQLRRTYPFIAMTGEKVNKKQLCSPAAEGEGEKVHGGQGCHQRVGWCTRAYPRILESRVLGWAKQQQNFALPAILLFNYSTFPLRSLYKLQEP